MSLMTYGIPFLKSGLFFQNPFSKPIEGIAPPPLGAAGQSPIKKFGKDS